MKKTTPLLNPTPHAEPKPNLNAKHDGQASKQKVLASSASAEPAENYEQAFAALEDIVRQIESGQLTLEASLAAYQRGNTLLQFCQQLLADTEQQVQLLNAKQELTPFYAETSDSHAQQ